VRLCSRCEPSPKIEAPGAIAQLGERLLCKQEVTGSIPVGSTIGIKVEPPQPPSGLGLRPLTAGLTVSRGLSRLSSTRPREEFERNWDQPDR
jgi:hypothetical protein